jgi:hypothetical protein
LFLLVFPMALLKYFISAVCMFCFCFSVVTQDSLPYISVGVYVELYIAIFVFDLSLSYLEDLY